MIRRTTGKNDTPHHGKEARKPAGGGGVGAPLLNGIKRGTQVLIIFAVGYFAGKRRGQGQALCPTSKALDVDSAPPGVAHSNANSRLPRGDPDEERAEFVVANSMDWNIPEDIREQRHKECDGRKTSSTGGFCLTKTTRIGGNWWVDTPLGEHLRDGLFRGMDVVDLGAGLGHYGKIFTEKGSPVKSWVGFDGAMNVQSATDGLVRFMDLTQPHPADERPCVKGDWVLSLEVAEHIPPEFTDHFVRNLRCSCAVGAVVSWARPHQTGGLGHVNTKTQDDAIAAMARWGFKVDQDATRAAQDAASMDHFKGNTIVYRVESK